MPGNILHTGSYFIRVNSGRGTVETWDLIETVQFKLQEETKLTPRRNRSGYIAPLLKWSVERQQDGNHEDV